MYYWNLRQHSLGSNKNLITFSHQLCLFDTAADIPEEISKLINMQRLVSTAGLHDHLYFFVHKNIFYAVNHIPSSFNKHPLSMFFHYII